MEEAGYYYCFFDFVIKSDIPLPELVECSPAPPLFSFSLCTSSLPQEPRWLHHWYLPHGELSISFARKGDFYYLRFPYLADFVFHKATANITCYPPLQVPLETVRHLLLDQVLPRLVSHYGRPTIHASGVQIDNIGLLFLGQTGWGKSTLGAYFHHRGQRLLSDDCLLVEQQKGVIVTLPSYASMRLLPDSFKMLDKEPQEAMDGHHQAKKRVFLDPNGIKQGKAVPLQYIFILNDPSELSVIDKEISITPLKGTLAAIELAKHTFHLDGTDVQLAKKQLLVLAGMCNNENLFLFSLRYPRDHRILSSVYSRILSLF